MSILFVDESKSKGYTMVAAVVAPSDARSLRSIVRGLVLPGQRRIHFTKESDSRKRLILSTMTGLGITAEVVHCSTKDARVGRRACLRSLVRLAADAGHSRIVLERDDSIEQADRRLLFEEVRHHGLADVLTYDLQPPHEEPLLWLADAVAWSHSKGGDWRRRIEPMVGSVTMARP